MVFDALTRPAKRHIEIKGQTDVQCKHPRTDNTYPADLPSSAGGIKSPADSVTNEDSRHNDCDPHGLDLQCHLGHGNNSDKKPIRVEAGPQELQNQLTNDTLKKLLEHKNKAKAGGHTKLQATNPRKTLQLMKNIDGHVSKAKQVQEVTLAEGRTGQIIDIRVSPGKVSRTLRVISGPCSRAKSYTLQNPNDVKPNVLVRSEKYQLSSCDDARGNSRDKEEHGWNRDRKSSSEASQNVIERASGKPNAESDAWNGSSKFINHDTLSLHVCRKCGCYFENETVLNHHRNKICQGLIHCASCRITFAYKGSVANLVPCTHVCKKCGLVFPMMCGHRNTTKDLTCELCTCDYFPDISHAKVIVHGSDCALNKASLRLPSTLNTCQCSGNTEQVKRTGTETTQSRPRSDLWTFAVKCVKCNTIFRTVSGLLLHLTAGLRNETFQCSPTLCEEHLNRNGAKTCHLCIRCNKIFLKEKLLREHRCVVALPIAYIGLRDMMNPMQMKTGSTDTKKVESCRKPPLVKPIFSENKTKDRTCQLDTCSGQCTHQSLLCEWCGITLQDCASLRGHAKKHARKITNVRCRHVPSTANAAHAYPMRLFPQEKDVILRKNSRKTVTQLQHWFPFTSHVKQTINASKSLPTRCSQDLPYKGPNSHLCDYCGLCFLDHFSFVKHMATHISDVPKHSQVMNYLDGVQRKNKAYNSQVGKATEPASDCPKTIFQYRPKKQEREFSSVKSAAFVSAMSQIVVKNTSEKQDVQSKTSNTRAILSMMGKDIEPAEPGKATERLLAAHKMASKSGPNKQDLDLTTPWKNNMSDCAASFVSAMPKIVMNYRTEKKGVQSVPLDQSTLYSLMTKDVESVDFGKKAEPDSGILKSIQNSGSVEKHPETKSTQNSLSHSVAKGIKIQELGNLLMKSALEKQDLRVATSKRNASISSVDKSSQLCKPITLDSGTTKTSVNQSEKQVDGSTTPRMNAKFTSADEGVESPQVSQPISLDRLTTKTFVKSGSERQDVGSTTPQRNTMFTSVDKDVMCLQITNPISLASGIDSAAEKSEKHGEGTRTPHRNTMFTSVDKEVETSQISKSTSLVSGTIKTLAESGTEQQRLGSTPKSIANICPVDDCVKLSQVTKSITLASGKAETFPKYGSEKQVVQITTPQRNDTLHSVDKGVKTFPISKQLSLASESANAIEKSESEKQFEESSMPQRNTQISSVDKGNVILHGSKTISIASEIASAAAKSESEKHALGSTTAHRNTMLGSVDKEVKTSQISKPTSLVSGTSETFTEYASEQQDVGSTTPRRVAKICPVNNGVNPLQVTKPITVVSGTVKTFAKSGTEKQVFQTITLQRNITLSSVYKGVKTSQITNPMSLASEMAIVIASSGLEKRGVDLSTPKRDAKFTSLDKIAGSTQIVRPKSPISRTAEIVVKQGFHHDVGSKTPKKNDNLFSKENSIESSQSSRPMSLTSGITNTIMKSGPEKDVLGSTPTKEDTTSPMNTGFESTQSKLTSLEGDDLLSGAPCFDTFSSNSYIDDISTATRSGFKGYKPARSTFESSAVKRGHWLLHSTKPKPAKIKKNDMKIPQERKISTVVSNAKISTTYQRSPQKSVVAQEISKGKIRSALSCDICNETFSGLPSLELHMTNCHSKVNCVLCDEVNFLSSEELKNHLLMHTI